jgi:hypothetical protein
VIFIEKNFSYSLCHLAIVFSRNIFAPGEMAERLIAAVLKTAEGDEPSGGSNPSLSATFLNSKETPPLEGFLYFKGTHALDYLIG